MRWSSLFAMKVRMLFGRRSAATQLDDELRDHLERQIAENIAAGMSAEEARYATFRSFGNPALLRDEARASWHWNSGEQLLRDLRYGIRTLRRTPGFASIAILVIALGIGANAALFTVVRSVLLKPLPFKDPDRLMMLYESGLKEDTTNVVAGGVYKEWKTQNHSFSNLALIHESRYGIAGSGGQLPESMLGARISWNLFPALGVTPALGRNFSNADDMLSANGTVILSGACGSGVSGPIRGSLTGRSISMPGRTR